MQDCVITEKFCEELDKLLLPTLGKTFTISRDPNGTYVFHVANSKSSARVIAVHSEQHNMFHPNWEES